MKLQLPAELTHAIHEIHVSGLDRVPPRRAAATAANWPAFVDAGADGSRPAVFRPPSDLPPPAPALPASAPASWPARYDVSGAAAQRIGLVGCVKTKLAVPAPAGDLFCSPLFRGRRRWVEQTCDRWLILSGRYGLVDPGRVLCPYDHSLVAASVQDRRTWASWVLAELEARIGQLKGYSFEIHAGVPYRDFGLTQGLVAAGASVEVPPLGMSQGEQLALYSSRRPPDPGR